MKCNYLNCNSEAYAKILGQPLCLKHFMIVRDDLEPLNAGRKTCLKMVELFDFLENKNKDQIKIKEVIFFFKVTFPTAKTKLSELEKYGFVVNVGNGIWNIKKERC